MTLIDARAVVWTIFLALVLSLPLHAPATAGERDQLDRGPKVGAPIPHPLDARDQRDQHQDFKSLARRRGLIILFSRSLDW
jgi:hypothetical protein